MRSFRLLLRYSVQEYAVLQTSGCRTVKQSHRNMTCFNLSNKTPIPTFQRALPLLPKYTTIVAANDSKGRLLTKEKDFTSCYRFCTDGRNEDIDIDYKQMTALVKAGTAQVIDVREAEEIEAFGDVPGAIHIPMGAVEEALEMPPHKFRALYQTELPDPEQSDLIFICSKGIRSHAAVMIAKELGFQRSWHFGKGYDYWKECSEKDGT